MKPNQNENKISMYKRIQASETNKKNWIWIEHRDEVDKLDYYLNFVIINIDREKRWT